MTHCQETDKIRYRDRIAAMMGLASCRHNPHGKRQEQRIYRCPFCHGFHLTSQEEWKSFEVTNCDIKCD